MKKNDENKVNMTLKEQKSKLEHRFSIIIIQTPWIIYNTQSWL